MLLISPRIAINKAVNSSMLAPYCRHPGILYVHAVRNNTAPAGMDPQPDNRAQYSRNNVLYKNGWVVLSMTTLAKSSLFKLKSFRKGA